MHFFFFIFEGEGANITDSGGSTCWQPHHFTFVYVTTQPTRKWGDPYMCNIQYTESRRRLHFTVKLSSNRTNNKCNYSYLFLTELKEGLKHTTHKKTKYKLKGPTNMQRLMGFYGGFHHQKATVKAFYMFYFWFSAFLDIFPEVHCPHEWVQ